LITEAKQYEATCKLNSPAPDKIVKDYILVTMNEYHNKMRQAISLLVMARAMRLFDGPSAKKE
jgi:hypothetical protein